jgi:hypothetical protein
MFAAGSDGEPVTDLNNLLKINTERSAKAVGYVDANLSGHSVKSAIRAEIHSRRILFPW